MANKYFFVQFLRKSRLSFKNLKETVLKAKFILNNCSLRYLEGDLLVNPPMLINDTNITVPKVSIDKDPIYSKKDGYTFVSSPAALQGCALEKVEFRISGSFMRRASFSSRSVLDLCVADVTQLGRESNNQDVIDW